MKRLLKAILILLFSVHGLQAQEFESGTNVINVGIGLGGDLGNFLTSSVSPSFSASYERGIWDIGDSGVVSLGGYLGFKSYRYEILGTTSKWSYTSLGVRGAYHYTALGVENLDVYGGAMLSYNIANFNGDSVGFLVGSNLSPTIFVGGRWYFNDTFGVFAEASYGVAYLTLGGVIRF